MKCFYHKSDFDGYCSGAIIKNKFHNCEMIGVDYENNINEFNMKLNEVVFVVDFGFKKEEMIQLNNKVELYWIDHHKTNIDWVKKNNFICSGGQLFSNKCAACELVWNYCYPNKKLPESVKLLSLYDVWDHRDINTLYFQYGMRSIDDIAPSNDKQIINFWNNVLNDDILHSIIDDGITCYNFEMIQNKKIAKEMAYVKEFEKLTAVVINKPYSNSKVFDSVYDENIHDIMILFGYKNGKYKYSLYSKNDIDVSKIAKKYGGGGHKHAAGFISNKLFI